MKVWITTLLKLIAIVLIFPLGEIVPEGIFNLVLVVVWFDALIIAIAGAFLIASKEYQGKYLESLNKLNKKSFGLTKLINTPMMTSVIGATLIYHDWWVSGLALFIANTLVLIGFSLAKTNSETKASEA